MTVWLPFQLGVRVAVARPARARSGLFFVVGALATVCALASLSGREVRDREATRAATLEPVFGDVGEPGLGYTALTQTYHGQSVLLIRVAPHGTNVSPPGLAELPAPGTAAVSPRLAALINDDTELRAWFGARPLTTLPRDAVGSAGELRAYIGVEPDRLGAVEQRDVVAFGAARPSTKGFGWYEAAGFALFVMLPAAGVVITASRFGRRSRNERNLALRLAGMSTAGANAVGAIEMAAPAAAGSTVAAVAYRVLLPDFTTLPVADRAVFGADARPAVSVSIVVMAVVVILAAFLGAGSATRTSRLVRLGSFLSPRRLTSPRSASVFAVGLLAVGAAWVRADPRDPILWIAILLLGIGLPGATAFAAQLVARSLTRPQAGLARLIAMRRIAADPPASARIAGTVAIAVFVVAAAQPITQVIATPTLDWVATARSAGQQSILSRAETLEAVPLELTTAPPDGVDVAVPATGLWTAGDAAGSRPDTTALIATCDELRDLVQADLPGCRAEPMRLQTAGSGDPVPLPPAGLELRAADGRSGVVIEAPSTVLTLPEDRLPIDASVLLPPGAPALAAIDHPYIAAAYLRVQADEPAWATTRGWIISSSPAYRLENAFEASATTDTTGRWALLGLIVTAGITALAAMLIAGDEAERQREWFGLRAMGMPRRQLVAIQIVESITTGITAMVLAVLGGVAVGSAFLQVGDETLSTTTVYLTASVGGLVVVVIAAAATSAAVRTRTLV